MDELELLAGRVEALERDARRWRLVATLGLLAAMATGGALAVHWRQGEIVARRVTLVDPAGNKRLILDARDAPGDPVIDFRDAEGRTRVNLNAKGGSTAALVISGGPENAQAVALGYMGVGTGAGLFLDGAASHAAIVTGSASPRFTMAEGDSVVAELPVPDFAAGPAGFNP